MNAFGKDFVARGPAGAAGGRGRRLGHGGRDGRRRVLGLLCCLVLVSIAKTGWLRCRRGRDRADLYQILLAIYVVPDV